MKRRTVVKALSALGLISLGSGAYLGNRWNLFKSVADLKYLDQKSGLLRELSEVIIPETDTPGAAASGVHYFVLLMIRDATDKRTQINFIDGIKDLEQYVKSTYEKEFEALLPSEKVEVLTHFEFQGQSLPGILGKAKDRFLGRSFFRTLKNYVSIGYFTSKNGATRALSYVAIPTRYESCVDLADQPKSWATE